MAEMIIPSRDALTQELLRRLVDYDPASGSFTWRERDVSLFNSEMSAKTWNTRFAGTVAGKASGRYVHIQIFGYRYYSHRLAWLYVTGRWPEHELDHRNRDGQDNSFENLRECSSSENKWNTRVKRSNITGVKGVKFDKRYNTYVARIHRNGQDYHLGTYATEELARVAYEAAAKVLSGEFVFRG